MGFLSFSITNREIKVIVEKITIKDPKSNKFSLVSTVCDVSGRVNMINNPITKKTIVKALKNFIGYFEGSNESFR